MIRTILSLLAAAALLATGCLRRTEGIVIAPDGSAKLMVRFEGDLEDLENGDAMPSKKIGWQISDKIAKEDDGSKHIDRSGVLHLPAGAEWPASYAEPRTDVEEIALEFPTTLRIEKQSDGTYYHFRRVYRARPAARIRYLNESILKDEQIQELAGKNPEEITNEEREKLAKAFIAFEAEKTITFIDQAARSLEDEVPQQAWLPVRPNVKAIYHSEELRAKTLELIAFLHTDDMEDEAAKLEEGVLADVLETLKTTLSNNGLSGSLIERFVRAYQLARKGYTITEDLTDEEWRVCIEMPGRIVAHSCDEEDLAPTEEPVVALEEENAPQEVDEEASGGDECGAWTGLPIDEPLFCQLFDDEFKRAPNRCCWNFTGDALLDYDVILMATSFVPHED